MLKGLIFLFGLMLAGVASASTLTPLAIPPVVLHNAMQSCVANQFAADDSVSGACQSVTWRCAGRSCQYTYTVYNTAWDVNGNVVSNVECATVLKPGSLPLRWTYQTGYSAANCKLPVYTGYSYVLINGNWYQYVTTSTDGAYELVIWGQNGQILAF
jgi:hypothetical protein